jgi:hypothetical protein
MILPKYNKNLEIIQKNGLTGDIISTLNGRFADAVTATEDYSKKFSQPTIYQSAFKVWYFIRNNINYVKDPAGMQIIQLPQALITRGFKRNGNTKGGDCKSMSLAVASIMHNLGAENVRLRYAGYFGDEPTHVYAVISINGRDVPIDPVIDKFDYEKPYKFKKDYKMNVYQLSGISATYDEKLNILKSRLKPGTIHFNLVSKEILKQSGRLSPETINPVQQQGYLDRLTRLKNMHEKTGKTGLLYQLVLNEINDVKSGIVYGGISGIGKISLKKAVQKITKAVKKVGLSPTRNAFLGLVEINVKGLATKIKALPKNKAAKVWEKFGGNADKLFKSVERGAKKKSLFGVEGIGMDPATATALASAAPVVAAFIALFSKNPTPKVDDKGLPVLDAAGQPILEEKTTIWEKIKQAAPGLLEKGLEAAKDIINISPKGDVEIKPDVEITDKQPTTGYAIPKNLLIFGGVGLAALLLLRKK